MKTRLLSLLLILSLNLSAQSQDFKFSSKQITANDSIFLINLPQLKLPDNYKSGNTKELPDFLDNSQLAFFRPVFNQFGWSCGQASSIGYNFTYEINRTRDLAADTNTTQYHPAFTYNFFTGGENSVGVCYYYTFDAIKHAGCPTIQDFGEINNGLTVWMDSYEKYYRAMKNRIDDVYSIYVGDEEGLLTLKHWMNDYLDGSENGGLANFYTDLGSYTVLPPESPEAGKNVIIHFGAYTGHSMTFIGWNDSIRYDYNEDGLFTNDIDINNDGLVTMKDWEIGGVILANSWGDGWADSGFCYVMYKVLAEEKLDGGIWNKSVNVIKVKEDYTPLLTYKVTLKHDCRNKIKVIAGISNDTTSLLPEKTMEFPIFNFQGGNYYLQGDNSAESFKTLEFGLDVSPLLSYVENNEPSRFFFNVQEHDPNNEGTGDLLAFSIIDYTNGENEISCQQTPMALFENGITSVSVVHTINTDKVHVETEDIPPFTPGNAYTVQIGATGGLEPYNWEIAMNYYENQEEETYPNIENEQLTPTNNNNGYAIKALDFPFPFYGKTYDTVMVHTDGFIMFRETSLPLPYQVNDMVLFRYETMLAPFLKKELLIASPQDKLLYEGNEDYAAFRWKENILTDEGMVLVDFSCILYPDGRIEYYYYDLNLDETLNWITGISKGDGENYQVSGFSNLLPVKTDHKTIFIPENYLSQIEIDNNGFLSIDPDDETQIYSVSVRVTDENEIFDTKSYQLSSGLKYSYSISSGDDDKVDYGETAYIDFEITNTTSETLSDVILNGGITDDYVNLVDDTEVIGDIAPGQTLEFENALAFDVSEFVPDAHSINIGLAFNATEKSWEANMHLTANSPLITIGELIIDDGNDNKLDPGDTVNLIFRLENKGHASIGPVSGLLENTDPFITFLSTANLDFGTVYEGAVIFDTVTILVDEDTPEEQLTVFNLSINALPLVQIEESYELWIGRHLLLLIELDPQSVSGPAILSAFEELGLTSYYTDQFPVHLNDYRNILITLGRFNNQYILSGYEGEQLASYLNLGGNIYMEGGRTWVDEPQTAVHPMFHTGIEDVSWHEVDSLFGLPFTLSSGMQFSYSSPIPYFNFYFIPDDTAYSVLYGQLDSNIYMTAYNNGNYKTIASALDFGGIDDGEYPSTKKKLMAGILDFFGIEGLITSENEMAQNKNSIGFSCFPNPTSGKTEFVFELDKPGIVNLDIISMNGKERMNVISKKTFSQGQTRISWDGTDRNLLPGVYICRLSTSDEVSFIKLVIK
jgi:hypothetical protein